MDCSSFVHPLSVSISGFPFITFITLQVMGKEEIFKSDEHERRCVEMINFADIRIPLEDNDVDEEVQRYMNNNNDII